MSNIRMPFGKHKGENIEEVPADYLVWLYENKEDLYGDIKEFIDDNLEDLRVQADLIKKSRKANS